MKLENMTFEQRLDYMSKLSPGAWESICRGCGLCCLCKYYTDDGGIEYARVACKNLDLKTRRCKCYECRLKRGACHNVDLEIVRAARVLPANCAYVEMLYGPAEKATIGAEHDEPRKQRETAIRVDWDTVVSENDISPVAAQRRIIKGSTKWAKQITDNR